MSKEISEALEIHQYMNEKNIIMSFMGELTHQVTTSLLKNLKDDMNAAKVDIITQKRLYGIIVECLDNIAKHWVALDIQKLLGRISPPIFMLSKKDDFYYIITGNHVPNDQVDMLASKIELVNALDKKGLQDYYRQTLAKESPLERDNAGLGIIDIVLKSGNKLEYEFKPVTPTVSFYVVQAKISL
ncbi:MAG: SiaB family protein kinase [Bacteroidia bacterium]